MTVEYRANAVFEFDTVSGNELYTLDRSMI